MSQCPRCHLENPLGSDACQACGTRLTGWGTAAAQPAMARPRVTIRVVRADGGPEATFLMKKDEIVAGTSAELLFMDDPFVARQQARLRFEGGALMVEDIGGGSGVFSRVRAERQLAVGQEMRCGRQRLIYEVLAPLPPGAPRTWGSSDEGCRGRLVQLLEGGLRGNAFPLHDGENMLGREVGDISFPGDGFVSGRHAVLTLRPEGLTVRDV
ncbi:MAG: FHA domain-containing protein, partial [Deltaproteobacteria bacterium]|nr:FHA domain-containing protein [Deltaproteobacteria bacterium]